jgi:hypothetical protein
VSQRRLGALLVLGGLALALGIQVAAPVGVPLYDGVVVVEPYRFLHPMEGQAGNPTSYEGSSAVVEGASPVVVAATTEAPPQAQLIAQRDAFELTPGATAVESRIEPIEPPAPTTTGPILGNVYRFSVTDQAGVPLDIRPPGECDGCVSLVLRAPEGGPPAGLMRFVGSTWEPVETRHAGTVAMYQTNPVTTGIYAVVATGEIVSEGLDPVLLLGIGGAALLVLALGALLYLRARPVEVPAAPPSRSSVAPGSPLPTKRKRPKRPSGRSG